MAPKCRVYVASASLPRNETLRRRTDNEAGTSSGTIVATCMPLFAASRPSSRSAFHRRNLRNIPDKRTSPQIPGKGTNTVRVHSQPFPTRSCTPKCACSRGYAPDRNRIPALEIKIAVPRARSLLAPGIGALRPLPACRTPRDEIALRSAACALATSRTPSLPRGSHKPANRAATNVPKHCPVHPQTSRRASRTSDVEFHLSPFHFHASLLHSAAFSYPPA